MKILTKYRDKLKFISVRNFETSIMLVIFDRIPGLVTNKYLKLTTAEKKIYITERYRLTLTSHVK